MRPSCAHLPLLRQSENPTTPVRHDWATPGEMSCHDLTVPVHRDLTVRVPVRRDLTVRVRRDLTVHVPVRRDLATPGGTKRADHGSGKLDGNLRLSSNLSWNQSQNSSLSSNSSLSLSSRRQVDS
jgi:hypothetical protein